MITVNGTAVETDIRTESVCLGVGIQTANGAVSGDIAMGKGGGTCPVYEVWTGGSY